MTTCFMFDLTASRPRGALWPQPGGSCDPLEPDWRPQGLAQTQPRPPQPRPLAGVHGRPGENNNHHFLSNDLNIFDQGLMWTSRLYISAHFPHQCLMGCVVGLTAVRLDISCFPPALLTDALLTQDILPARLLGPVPRVLPGAGLAGPAGLLPGALHGPGQPGQGPRLDSQPRPETLPGAATFFKEFAGFYTILLEQWLDLYWHNSILCIGSVHRSSAGPGILRIPHYGCVPFSINED